MTRDIVTMATQSSTGGGWDMEHDGEGSQGAAEPNFIPQPSTSPEPLSNHKQLKTRTHTSKDALPQKLVHVGALEVQNVKRAIHRYGTLPKNARIGAYLESLRQSGMPANQENSGPSGSPSMSASTIETPQQSLEAPASVGLKDVHQQQHQQQHRSLSPRQNNLRNQPQMTRSNSSSGVVNTYQPPNSPRSRNTVGSSRKNNTESNSLRTFRVPPNTSTFRTASPPRPAPPSLADLEFPPPPLDLPPPPTELLNSGDQCDLLPPLSVSPSSQSRNTTGSLSPTGLRKASKIERRSREEPTSDEQDERSSDLQSAEPSVMEASSRFGVNLRRREQQQQKSNEPKVADACGQTSPQDESVSMLTLPPPPPPPPPPPLEELSTERQESNGSSNLGTFSSKPGMKEMLELKLINEIKQSCETKSTGTLRRTNFPCSNVPLDPASQLLSELCATFNVDGHKQNEYASANIIGSSALAEPREQQPPVASPLTDAGALGFKLKKVERRANPPPPKEENIDNQIIDFKARLRKVDNAVEKPSTATDDKVASGPGGSKKSDDERASVADSLDCPSDEQSDDKRRSTGSISSLKKLWENKESTGGTETNSAQPPPSSPKLGGSSRTMTNKQEASGDAGEDSPEDLSGASTRSSMTSKSEGRVHWPPLTSTGAEVEKPVVPAKPTKSLVPSGKHFSGPSIYATPNCHKIGSDEEHTSPKLSSDSGTKNTSSNKQSILEISNVIENSIVNLKGSPNIVMASWLQLSDKVGLLHGMCSNYTQEATIPPHAKFQFRDVLSRLELQARQLRVAGTRNISENTRLLTDVQNTIKDVNNVVQR